MTAAAGDSGQSKKPRPQPVEKPTGGGQHPLFTAADLEPSDEEMAKARGWVAGRDRAGTNMITALALRHSIDVLADSLTRPYGAEFAASQIRILIAAARAADERIDVLDAELDARLAELDAQHSTTGGRVTSDERGQEPALADVADRPGTGAPGCDRRRPACPERWPLMSRFARVHWLYCDRCNASYTSEQGHPRCPKPIRIVVRRTTRMEGTR